MTNLEKLLEWANQNQKRVQFIRSFSENHSAQAEIIDLRNSRSESEMSCCPSFKNPAISQK